MAFPRKLLIPARTSSPSCGRTGSRSRCPLSWRSAPRSWRIGSRRSGPSTTARSTAIVWIAWLGVMLFYPVRRFIWWVTSNFVVTTSRVIHREGFIAKRSMEIPLDKINDVRFEQGLFERIVGAGTLVIQSASETGRNEFVVHPASGGGPAGRSTRRARRTNTRRCGRPRPRRRDATTGPVDAARACRTHAAGARHAGHEPCRPQRDHRARAPRRPAQPRGPDRGGVPGAEGEDPGPTVIGPLDHVYYWVRDMDAAVVFYADVLELALLRRDGNEWAEFDAGPVRLALHGSERAEEGGATAVFRVAISRPLDGSSSPGGSGSTITSARSPASRASPPSATRTATRCSSSSTRPADPRRGCVTAATYAGPMSAETCPRCGEPLPPRARFCPNCGAPVSIPPASERRVVTVVFVDLAGSTELAARLDPERYREVLAAFHGAVTDEITLLGGRAEGFIGDAVLGVFGVPDLARRRRAARDPRGPGHRGPHGPPAGAPRPPDAHGGAHRGEHRARGGRHGHRPQPRDRRGGEHRRPAPTGRRARRDPGRRDHPPAHGGIGRVRRAARSIEAKGFDEAISAWLVIGLTGGGTRQVDPARRPAAGDGAARRHLRAGPGTWARPPGDPSGGAGDRQEPGRGGVPRHPARRGEGPLRPLEPVRGGGHVLAARPDGLPRDRRGARRSGGADPRTPPRDRGRLG